MHNPAYRAYVRRFVPIMLAYVAAIILASFAIPDGAQATGWSIAIALLPGLAIVGVIWAMGRLLIELSDEYLRMIEVKKALIATGFALAVTSVWGLLELYTDVPRVPIFFVFPVWCAGLGLGSLWARVSER
jgi:hypothetical protein